MTRQLVRFQRIYRNAKARAREEHERGDRRYKRKYLQEALRYLRRLCSMESFDPANKAEHAAKVNAK